MFISYHKGAVQCEKKKKTHRLLLEVSFRTPEAVFLLQTDVCSGFVLWQLQTQEMCFESWSLSHWKHTVSSVSNNPTKCIHEATEEHLRDTAVMQSHPHSLNTFHVMFRTPHVTNAKYMQEYATRMMRWNLISDLIKAVSFCVRVFSLMVAAILWSHDPLNCSRFISLTPKYLKRSKLIISKQMFLIRQR